MLDRGSLVMSDNWVEGHGSSQALCEGGSDYVAPAGEWHDLKVITLGGPSGTGDSGSPNVQLNPSLTQYDEADEDYDNFI
jgi:hypothetical protein